MYFRGIISFIALLALTLLTACSGGASPDTPSYVGKIFIGGAYVEGLDYEIVSDSGTVKTGTTGPGGTFNYQTNDSVTFKVGAAILPAYKLNASGTKKLTHFDILATRDPNALVIQNISVLLNFLDDDYAPGQNYLANGIKIDSRKLEVAAQAFLKYPQSDTADGALKALNDSKFLEQLTAKAGDSAYSVPNVADVLARSRTILNNPASRIEIAPVAVGTGTYNDFNKTITLSASDSYDANSDNLTYAWTLLNRPKGSAATLVTPTASTATAVADIVSPEPYVFQLTVKDATNLPSAAQVTVYVQGLNVSPTIKSSSVYMAGALVEGLPYSTGRPTPCPGDTASVLQTECRTGPKGLFNYQSGDTVTFKLGATPAPVLGAYTLKLDAPSPLTLFDIVGSTNPNSTTIKNISVLLHTLDDNQNIANDIKINPLSLQTAAAVTDALTAESYLISLRDSMKKAGVTVPSTDAVMALATADMKSDGIPMAPYANASASFNPFSNVISLSGAGSADANSDDLKYSWTLVSKPKASSAVIATPTLGTASLVADDLSEPYVFRLTVTDTTAPTPLTNASQVTVNVGQASVTGIYVNPLNPPNPNNENPSTLQVSPTYARQVVAITDTQEMWGYTYYPDKLARKFSGPIARAASSSANFTVSPLSFQTNPLCTLFVGTGGVKGCDTQIDLSLDVPNPGSVNGRQLTVNSEWAKQFLFATGTVNAGQLTSVTASNAPAMQIANFVGIFREKSETGNPPYKDWKITAKGEFNFYKTLADGKLTLCALGQFDLDNTGQVLNRQRLVTRNAMPVNLEFKNECDENFDVGTFSTGYLFADPTLGNAGFTFIGKNISGSKFTLKHFKRE